MLCKIYLLKGEIDCTTYKNLDGRILYAGTEKRVFGLLKWRLMVFIPVILIFKK